MRRASLKWRLTGVFFALVPGCVAVIGLLGISQVRTALTQMDRVTQSNAAGAEESAAASAPLSVQAQRAQGVVRELPDIGDGGHIVHIAKQRTCAGRIVN